MKLLKYGINMLQVTNRPLFILNLTVLFQQQRYIIPVLFLFYIQNGLTFSDFLLFQSIFYFTGLIAEIPAGYIGDIFSRKNVLIFSYCLFIVRIIMWIIRPNYITIMLGEILYGLSKAFYRGVSDGYIYDYLKANKITETMLSNYGKFNFYMSMGSALSGIIGAYLYQYFGFTVLLTIELFFNTASIVLLLFLPKIQQYKKRFLLTPIQHIKRILHILRKTVKNSKINVYMFYSAILTGITSVFVWNFQPFMKAAGVSAVLFGYVFFINHLLRALGSLKAKQIIDIFSLPKTGAIVWILYLLSFAVMLNSLKYNNISICLLTILFICIAIGIQMTFNVGSLSRIHGLIPSISRATMSSVNSMLSGLCSGVFLLIFKLFVDYHSQKTAIIFFIILFVFVIIPVKRILTIK